MDKKMDKRPPFPDKGRGQRRTNEPDKARFCPLLLSALN